MRNIFLLTFITLSLAGYCQQKSSLLLRSTTSMAGASSTVSLNGSNYLMQQTVGQSSPAGTVFDANFVARQGFLHPFVLARLAKQIDPFGLNVYPNPIVDNINISIAEPYTGKMYLNIFDYRGRLVAKETYQNQQEVVFNARYFAKGTYFLRVIIGEQQKVVQIVKAR